MNRKTAPQQAIKTIERTGSWGNIEYRHLLVCGHTETRKRPSQAPKIACTWCVIAAEKNRELQALTIVQSPQITEEIWDFYDESVSDELSIANLRSGIATAIGCQNENIEVVSSIGDDGVLRVNYVTIFLDYQQAVNLGTRKT